MSVFFSFLGVDYTLCPHSGSCTLGFLLLVFPPEVVGVSVGSFNAIMGFFALEDSMGFYHLKTKVKMAF